MLSPGLMVRSLWPFAVRVAVGAGATKETPSAEANVIRFVVAFPLPDHCGSVVYDVDWGPIAPFGNFHQYQYGSTSTTIAPRANALVAHEESSLTGHVVSLLHIHD